MKALSIAMFIAVAVCLSGCCNLKARTAPKAACLVNPCAKPAVCTPCKPAKVVCKTVEK
jgi:uncharacterized protein YceK